MIRKHTHIGSYGIISKNNQLLLIKKARGGYTGKLDLPGGGIEHTESPEQALNREIMEEAGIKISKNRLLGVKSNNITWRIKDNYYEDLHHIGVIYLVNTNDKNIKTEPDGIDSLGANWYDINTLNEENLTPFEKYALDYLKNKNK